MRIIAVAVCLLLCACEPKLREGEVTGNGHRPAETILIFMPMTACAGGKEMTCTTMLIPMFFFYPERWFVDIKKFNGKSWETATWWVPKSVFDQVKVGGYFKVTDNCLDSEPRQRTSGT